ncbi:hypothetical protein HMPREF0290_0895 [Corynebacterium efficiens YS-314]|uniref:Uncharacterized protein n=1 Tax=Corynebacterium efficiens (strain DSM 44549 / YS-314 / AJ 12310 / JCM 11189 / NBRC 100395) TaxID=196164 RepID=Q8FRD1_COREF|nr:hypothetical protein [Corynebacterium efficiens]EEW50447.1 hypothetical protein HMPREF0290_0895 [Corynebacterium efficiens YS-314]BAC17640.1 hypothetical protein [Corynebacterium efficiens YS-314]
MSDVMVLYVLLLVLTACFCVIIFWLTEWVIRLRKANEEMDADLCDAEEQLHEHVGILRDLEIMRRKLESVPARITALEARNRVVAAEGGEDDVVYVSG